MLIDGEPAEFLTELRRRGLITSYTDGVIQAIRLFKEKVTEQDLKLVQLMNMKNIREEI